MIVTNGAAAPAPVRYPLPDLAGSLVITWPILTTSGGAAATSLTGTRAIYSTLEPNPQHTPSGSASSARIRSVAS